MIFLPLSNPWVIFTFVVVFSLSASCGQEQLYRVWCQELFPTAMRTTAQGIVIFAQKVVLAVWSLFTPMIVAASFQAFTWVLFAAVSASVLIGVIWMPKRPESLEQVGRDEALTAAGGAIHR